MSLQKKIIQGVFFVLTVCFISSAAFASDFFVTRFDDPPPVDCDVDDCSLREAVQDANDVSTPNNTIHMPFGTYTLTQVAKGPLLVDTNSLTVNGNGSTIDASALFNRIFSTNGDSIDIILNDLTLTGGQSVGGGAILFQAMVFSDFLTLNRVLITGNSATGVNGGGGVLVEEGTLNCNYSTISDNQSSTFGGGVTVMEGQFGSTNCTISGNQADTDGGGVFAEESLVILDFTTITDNHAGDEGGGAFQNLDTAMTGIIFVNSILAENTAASGSNDCNKDPGTAVVFSLGANIFGDVDDCGITLMDADKDNVADAGLLPLGDYGGPTPTHLLEEDSIARGNVPPGCLDEDDDLAVDDQRGQVRPAGSNCDSGAVELGTADLEIIKTAIPGTGADSGAVVLYTLTVNNNGPNKNFNVMVTDNLPAGSIFQLSETSKGSCSFSGGVVTCELGEMDSGESVIISIVVFLTTLGTNTNTANVSGTEIDPDSSNNSSSAVVMLEEGGVVVVVVEGEEGGGCILGKPSRGRNFSIPLAILILGTAWFLARKRLT